MSQHANLGETRTSAPTAPGGLQPTLPSRPEPSSDLREALPSEPPPVPAPAEPQARSWEFQQDATYVQPTQQRVSQGGTVDIGKRQSGIKNILGGTVLIAIGFAFGGSVFLGNPEPIDYFFDGLGTLWVLKGVWDLFSA